MNRTATSTVSDGRTATVSFQPNAESRPGPPRETTWNRVEMHVHRMRHVRW